MFMGLEKEIKPGDTIKITLKTTDGDTFDFEAPAKEFTGANENYEDGQGDMGHGDHGDHDHGDDHSDH